VGVQLLFLASSPLLVHPTLESVDYGKASGEEIRYRFRSRVGYGKLSNIGRQGVNCHGMYIDSCLFYISLPFACSLLFDATMVQSLDNGM